MIVRHIIFAGLFATASFANAGTIEASAVTVQPAWTFSAGTANAEPKAMQSTLAGFAGGMWSSTDRMGDIGSSKMMLFSQSGSPLSSVQLSSAPVSNAPTASAPAESAPVTAAITASSPAPAATPDFFVEAAEPPTVPVNAAPAASEMAAIVVAADVISADAPAALAAIPEPATGLLMLAGLLGAGFMNRRRK
jgi:hypothetical protein